MPPSATSTMCRRTGLPAMMLSKPCSFLRTGRQWPGLSSPRLLKGHTGPCWRRSMGSRLVRWPTSCASQSDMPRRWSERTSTDWHKRSSNAGLTFLWSLSDSLRMIPALFVSLRLLSRPETHCYCIEGIKGSKPCIHVVAMQLDNGECEPVDTTPMAKSVRKCGRPKKSAKQNY